MGKVKSMIWKATVSSTIGVCVFELFCGWVPLNLIK